MRLVDCSDMLGNWSRGSTSELSDTTLGTSLEWKPTRCAKPAEPSFHVTDIDSYNSAVDKFNDHPLQVRIYRACVNEGAPTDAEMDAQSIGSGVDGVYDQIRVELESARSEPKSARESLQ